MIVFDLACDCGLRFEGWFRDSDDFERQQEGELICCPSCQGSRVRKILSPVSVRLKGERNHPLDPRESATEEATAEVLRSLQEYVVSNYEDVGPTLAEESLKIHYGLEEPRNIRGSSTEEEEKVLKKEGIEILKIPLPAKSNKH
jgi:hypothetical protein